jgi:hypothetical protein
VNIKAKPIRRQKKRLIKPKVRIYKEKAGTPGARVLELIKRAYKSNTLEKLRDFLTVESPEFQPEAV